jgi:hypothetical protein
MDLEAYNLIKSFCGCFTVQGAVFTKSAPWPPEAKIIGCQNRFFFGLEDYYEIMKSPACTLRLKEDLSRIASGLTRKQRGDILDFIDFCHRETPDKWKRQSEIWQIVRKIFQT